MTTDVNEVHWLDESGKGQTWDWLQNLPLMVSYIEDEETGALTHYRARIINWDLEKFLLCVQWVDEASTEPGGAAEDADWISLVEDDWSWVDGERY